MRLKQCLILPIVVLAANAFIVAAHAQTAQDREVKAAAASFYRMHVPHFGFPLEKDLRRLHPYVSPELNSLLANELSRMREWSAKNPNEKPPLIEDLFICNRYEPPQRFRVLRAKLTGDKGLATVKFEYIEGGQLVASCEVEATFVRARGKGKRKWLLDNVDWATTPDLRALLSREDYLLVPE